MPSLLASFNHELHEWARIVNIAFRAAGRPRASAPWREKNQPVPPGGPDGAGPSTMATPPREKDPHNPSFLGGSVFIYSFEPGPVEATAKDAGEMQRQESDEIMFIQSALANDGSKGSRLEVLLKRNGHREGF